MPWYKTGTVKTTINSNAIIGTGTAFISNSRVGDAFRGPDGAWYEVVNIASNTAMSISPNYQGPTVAAGTYSIAPMQGYVKESADRLRQTVESIGATLALFGGATNVTQLRANIGAAQNGTNSDITNITGLTTALSIAQGGTGSTTAESARDVLGLGKGAIPEFSSIELFAPKPFIDFHFNNTPADHSVRLINDRDGTLTCIGVFSPDALACKRGLYGERNYGSTNAYNFFWGGGALETWIDDTNVGSVSLITSDYRIKRNIETFNTPFLDRIDAYRIVTYETKDFSVWRDDGRLHQGLIAHEVQEVNPLATVGDKDAVDDDGRPIIQQLDPMALITDLMGAIKELRAEVNNLKSRLS